MLRSVACCALLAQVLEVGCGNSRLGEELLWAGVACGVTCIDLSTVAVQRMCDSLAELGTSGVVVMVADMLDLPFDSESFDLRERDHGTCFASLPYQWRLDK